MSDNELDRTDIRILAELQRDGRLSNQELADRVSLSPSPCLRRVRRLEEKGFIKKYVALIDAGKVGLGLLAYVNIRLNKYSGSSHAPMSDFARDVQLWPEVVECYAMSGTWTICCASRWLTWRISPVRHGYADAASRRGGHALLLRATADQGDNGTALVGRGRAIRDGWLLQGMRPEPARGRAGSYALECASFYI